MTDTLFDATECDDDDDEQCANCAATIDDDNPVISDVNGEWCRECFVNTDCPAECSEPHDPPGLPGDEDYEWECPTENVTYWWLGSENYRYGNRGTTRTDGEWVDYETISVGGRRIDIDDAFHCDSCGEWCHNDNYAGDSQCDECWRDPDYYGSDDYGTVGPAVTVTCDCCRNRVTHYDPMTEAVYCQDHAGLNPPIPALIPAGTRVVRAMAA